MLFCSENYTEVGYLYPICCCSNIGLSNSYYCEKISSISGNDGIGAQYEDLFKQSTYENWDFDNIWQIEEGRTTPYLRWMKNPPKELTKEYIDGTISN